MGEVIANTHHDGFFHAYSAGSQPAGEVHPLTLKFLQQRGLPTETLESQSWDAFEGYAFDLVITVCDNAAEEPCPLWLGDAPRVHWGMPDPSRVDGGEREIEQAFSDVIDALDEHLTELRQSLT